MRQTAVVGGKKRLARCFRELEVDSTKKLPKSQKDFVHCISLEKSRYHYSLRRWGRALLAQNENLGTGRCFSFPTVMPVPESSLPAVDWPGLEHTPCWTTDTPNGNKPLTYYTPCELRIATKSSAKEAVNIERCVYTMCSRSAASTFETKKRRRVGGRKAPQYEYSLLLKIAYIK